MTLALSTDIFLFILRTGEIGALACWITAGRDRHNMMQPLACLVIATAIPWSWSADVASTFLPAAEESVVSDKPGPRWSAAQATFNFGRVLVGDQVTARFTLACTGQAAVTITRVEPACGCILPADGERRLVPGKTCEITATLRTETLAGPISKRLVVHTDDPARPRFELTIAGTVVTPIEVMPVACDFGSIDGTTAITRTLEIVNHLSDPIRLGAPTSGNPAFVPTIEVIEPGRRFRLHVRTAAPLAIGPHTGIIAIDTGAERSGLSISVQGVVTP